jgi:hypothetical protein
VSKEVYKEHLNGGNGVAIAPLRNTDGANNVCYYAAIDIDVYGVSFTHLVKRLYDVGFKFAAFRSKSGGLHIYFFFADAEPGDKVVATLKRLVEVYGLSRLYVNEKNKSKVEIFPKQTVTVQGQRDGNGLFLPFYNAKKSKQNMLTAEGKSANIIKALPVIESMFTSVAELSATLDGLPYSDAPFCVQMILLTGALAENDGRNDFLFHTATYLKKKYTDNFYEQLSGANDCLEVPLEKREVDSVYKSITSKGFDNYACKKSPCGDYCDKKFCALREYGVGKLRNNRFTGADCWGVLTKVMAEEPYYLWQVRIKPEDEFKTVRVDSVDDLQNQSVLQKRCWRDLNWAPFKVKDNDWIATVNGAMEGIEERMVEISKETDTSEMGMLRNLFVQYLTHRQAHEGQTYMVQLGYVYHTGGEYFFVTQGVVDFLRSAKFNIGKTNLREQLLSYGCTDGELKYTTAKGEEKTIDCWKKPDDEELSKADTRYEDISEGKIEGIQKNILDKEDTGNKQEDMENDDTKF